MKSKAAQTLTFLMVDSDEDDTILMQEAFYESNMHSHLYCVKDAVQLAEYLRGDGIYQARDSYPLPNIILLELGAPIITALSTLEWLKSSAELRRIPVVIFANGLDESLVSRAYELGASSYIVKPTTFCELQRIVRGFHDYWSLCARPNVSENYPARKDSKRTLTLAPSPVPANTNAH
ncbi:response regulator [Paraglaciecola polaris]|uniref:Response regulatory domain-containing protein n=1 Tax=Paraglaciecola polaris LMG 21857 TaxID=1129793 RepID=K6Z924_9ALTE|nr:response regulator transcription factor [Paraglaciecola polaris]GAC32666.1 hypothetical protein GPLA_1756 [Paraglaciecola polaris LMG 21857]|tara:strand:- start:1956 stop:2489 length:534 start_codon:yes stop_codon:yes gene_type:complete